MDALLFEPCPCKRVQPSPQWYLRLLTCHQLSRAAPSQHHTTTFHAFITALQASVNILSGSPVHAAQRHEALRINLPGVPVTNTREQRAGHNPIYAHTALLSAANPAACTCAWQQTPSSSQLKAQRPKNSGIRMPGLSAGPISNKR